MGWNALPRIKEVDLLINLVSNSRLIIISSTKSIYVNSVIRIAEDKGRRFPISQLL